MLVIRDTEPPFLPFPFQTLLHVHVAWYHGTGWNNIMLIIHVPHMQIIIKIPNSNCIIHVTAFVCMISAGECPQTADRSPFNGN